MFSDASLAAFVAGGSGLAAAGFLVYLLYSSRWRANDKPAISKRNFLWSVVISFISGMAFGMVLFG